MFECTIPTHFGRDRQFFTMLRRSICRGVVAEQGVACSRGRASNLRCFVSVGCDDHQSLKCHRRRVHASAAAAAEGSGRSWGGDSSTTIATHTPLRFDSSRKLSIVASEDHDDDPALHVEKDEKLVVVSAKEESDVMGSIHVEGLVDDAKEFVQDGNATNKNENETVDSLKKETERLLRLLDPNNEDDAAIVAERSKLDLMEIDSIFEGWSRVHETSASNGMFAAESAESILVALEENYDRNWQKTLEDKDANVGWSLKPNDASYNFVLHSFAVSYGGRVAASKAQMILEKMIGRCQKYAADMHNTDVGAAALDPPPPPPPAPTAKSFNCVINAWSKFKNEKAGEKAEKVFRLMEEWAFDCQKIEKEGDDGDAEYSSMLHLYYDGCKPSARSFGGVITAWANSNTGMLATDRVSAILDQMIEKRKAAVADAMEADDEEEFNNSSIAFPKPNVIIFNAVIKAFAKGEMGMKGAEKAQELVERMFRLDESEELGGDDYDWDDEDDVGLKPNTRSFSTILDAYSQCARDDGDGPEAVRRAEILLKRMEELYVIDGYDVKPNNVCFSEVITALARCKGIDDAADRAEILLEKLIALYRDSDDDEEMKPTVQTFNSLITTHARSRKPDAVERAQKVFDLMCDYSTPDATSYSALIDAIAKSRSPDAGEKALALFHQMEEDKNVEVDSYAYNSTINALGVGYGESSVANKALILLDKMEDEYAKGNTKLKPDRHSYTATMQALMRTADGAEIGPKARAVLDRFIKRSEDDQSIQPDTFAFTTCINACASIHIDRETDPKDKRQNLVIAIQTFEELKKSNYGSPNEFTYCAVVKACSRLGMDMDEKDRLIKALFKECCDTGLLSKQCLMWIKRGTSSNLKRELFSELDENYGQEGGQLIPSSWTYAVRNRRNVPRHTFDHSGANSGIERRRASRQYSQK